MIEPVGAAIVVTAQSFNPSIFTQLWLSKNDLVDEADFKGTSLTTDGVAQHDLADMQLLVVPPRLQVTLKPGDEASAEAGRALVDKVVDKLPHTPLQALGMNLNYLVSFDEGDFTELDRAMFLAERSPFAEAFPDGNPRFGGYFSRDIDGVRMKLDIKPISTGGEVGVGDKFRCSFNYHLGLKGAEQTVAVHGALAKWHALRAQSVALVERIERFGSEGR